MMITALPPVVSPETTASNPAGQYSIFGQRLQTHFLLRWGFNFYAKRILAWSQIKDPNLPWQKICETIDSWGQRVEVFWVVNLSQPSRLLRAGTTVFRTTLLSKCSWGYKPIVPPRIEEAVELAEQELGDVPFFHLEPLWKEAGRTLTPPEEIQEKEQRQEAQVRRYLRRCRLFRWLSLGVSERLRMVRYDPVVVFEDPENTKDLRLIAHWD